jgi:RNA polymerase sigma factor (sigma-70 family)
MTKPFRVDLHLRNNRMATIRGERTQAAMDELCGTSIGTWGSFEHLRKSPLTINRLVQKRCYVCSENISARAVVCKEHRDYKAEAEASLPSTWSETALKIAEAINHDPEWIWPECIQAIRRAEKVFVELSLDQAQQLSDMTLAIEEGKEVIDEALKRLPQREEEILRKRFGFDGKGSKTLQEIADVYHLSRDRIRQIECSGIRKLRRMGRQGYFEGLGYEKEGSSEHDESTIISFPSERDSSRSYDQVRRDLIRQGLAYTNEELWRGQHHIDRAEKRKRLRAFHSGHSDDQA